MALSRGQIPGFAGLVSNGRPQAPSVLGEVSSPSCSQMAKLIGAAELEQRQCTGLCHRPWPTLANRWISAATRSGTFRRLTRRCEMRAITIVPGVPHSARLDDIPEPPVSEGMLAVQGVALGVCATDREIIAGNYGSAPPGQERLVLGHESLGRVEEAPSGSGFERGDLVVGIVRRPDPVPCPACAVGEWDMCQ